MAKQVVKVAAREGMAATRVEPKVMVLTLLTLGQRMEMGAMARWAAEALASREVWAPHFLRKVGWMEVNG